MKKLSAALTVFAVLLILIVFSSLRTVHAQTAVRNAKPMTYDASREVTITATVSSVFSQARPGMIAGSHLLLATPSGAVDASLGKFGLRGDGALPVSAGQPIEVTGVMNMIKNKLVFLVRIVKVGDEVYAIRNEHGVVLSPQARDRISQQTGQKGDSL